MRFTELAMGAQTAYSELMEQAHALELQASLSGLPGKFHRRQIKGRDYWYFGYRDIDGRGRMVYVGPDDERVRKLVARFDQQKNPATLAPQSRAAIELGCAATLPKHFRVIRRLAEYGFFRVGGLLIGTHAFQALGNLLGVRWLSGERTLDVDFAHAGKNISLALPANIHIDVHGALESLEMGLLPITQFNGIAGSQYRNPDDAELRLDFVTSRTRNPGQPVVMPDLNLALEPLKFMEYGLQDTTQGCILGRDGACVANLPAPERYAVHKLIVYGERPVSQRAKAGKDILQAACLVEYFLATGRQAEFNAAWRDALGRGKGWQARALQGQKALLRGAPDLADEALWHAA